MGPLNPEMDAEAFRLAAEAQVALIQAPGGAVGRMSAERWAELAAQLKQLGLVKEAQPPERYFTNPE